MTLERKYCVVVAEPKARAELLHGVKDFAEDHNLQYTLVERQQDPFFVMNLVSRAAFMWIWNGSQMSTGNYAAYCKAKKVPHVFFEQGFLPQKKSMSIDLKGFCGHSFLCDSLHWVTDEDRAKMLVMRVELQEQYGFVDDDYVLVPLQVPQDSQVYYHSPYRSMTEFCRAVIEMYPRKRIVFRPHPMSPNVRIPDAPNVETATLGTSFLEQAARASVVVGINSTCLIEAGILGKPVVALGNCPLRAHAPDDRDDVLAAHVAMRQAKDEEDFTGLLRRFNLKPLGREFAEAALA